MISKFGLMVLVVGIVLAISLLDLTEASEELVGHKKSTPKTTVKKSSTKLTKTYSGPTRSCHLRLNSSTSTVLSANIDSNKVISATRFDSPTLTVWDPVECSVVKTAYLPYGYRSLFVMRDNSILAGAGDFSWKLDKYAYPSLSKVK
jgi:hypothetical protein